MCPRFEMNTALAVFMTQCLLASAGIRVLRVLIKCGEQSVKREKRKREINIRTCLQLMVS